MASSRVMPQGATQSAPAAPSGWAGCRHRRASAASPPRHAAAHPRCPSRLVAARSGATQSATPAGVLSLADVRVSDAMKSPPVTVSPDTSVFDVLELLVTLRISGAPVVDAAGKVLGMISGYDLLVLDATPGHLDKSDGMFPPVGRCDQFGGSLSRMWDSFKSHQEVLSKVTGQTAGEVCHEASCIHASAALEDAADKIVRCKVHRLAVVDDNNTCVGVLSRGDILQATYRVMKSHSSSG